MLEALLNRAGLSHAGLAKQLNLRGAHLGLRYDHASVARWIRDHAIPRDPVPEMICDIVSERLRLVITPSDAGMMRGEAADRHLPLTGAVDRAAALWQGDARGRTPSTLIAGAKAVAPIWEWENPPDDEHIARLGERRVDPADVTMLRRARAHYQQMYRRVGGIPVRPRIATLLTEHATPLLRASYDNQLGRDLYRAVGGLAAFAGVCAYDADQQPLAQRYFFTALRLAKASADRQFGAYIVALLANQALYLTSDDWSCNTQKVRCARQVTASARAHHRPACTRWQGVRAHGRRTCMPASPAHIRTRGRETQRTPRSRRNVLHPTGPR